MKRNLFRLTSRRRAIAVSLLAIVVTSLALTMFLHAPKAKAAWWNNSWYYRKKITFDNSASSSALSNFPVRVALSASNIDYGHTQNAGQDIRFVDSDDTTALPYEIENWNESGTSDVWVQVPQITATNTDFIWMYYGNASASDGQTKNPVWDSNFAAVWHFGETSGTLLADSTSNANNGTKGSSSSPSVTTGKIAGAQLYTTSTVTVPDKPSLRMNDNLTISVWFNATSLPTWATLICKDQNFAPNYCIQYDDTGKMQFNYGASFIASRTATTPSTNTWYLLSVVYDNANNQVRLYLNGNLDNTVTQTTALPSNTDTMDIGNDVFNEYWNGTIDEMRVSNSIRSADWLKAEYLTENNAMNSFGAEEQYPPDPPVLTALGNSAALQPTFQLRSADRVDPDYLRYKIEVCSTSDCSSIVRTIDQTSSQTGWSGQDAQSGTAYVASATLASSTLASHAYQTPALSLGTQYWWRAYAKDPAGSNVWSDPSGIASFITTGPPAAPTLSEPISSVQAPLAPMFRMATTDPNGDYVRYKIEVCSTSNCSAIVRTIDQTSSQTGWMSQDVSSGTAYSASTVLSSSQNAVHVYQSPVLSGGTQYWWRAYAIDPGGYNQWSAASSIGTFTATPSKVNITGGTTIRGGTKVGQ